MNKIYLVKYLDENTIEGFVYRKEDFEKWLSNHNKERVRMGEMPEQKSEFELIEVIEL